MAVEVVGLGDGKRFNGCRGTGFGSHVSRRIINVKLLVMQ